MTRILPHWVEPKALIGFTGLYFVLGLLFLYLTGREIAHGPADPLPAQVLP